MTTPGLLRSSSTRSVKKLEKPRPLKISGNLNRSTSSEISPRYSGISWDEIMLRVDDVSQCISNQNFDDSLLTHVYNLNGYLKMYGQQLESIYKDQLDRAFVIFRNGCSNERVNLQCRAYLLELIELRANQWLNCDSICSYYNNRMASTDTEPLTTPDALSSGIGLMNLQAASPTNTTVLGPGEVLKTSGKYPKPTKISGKNYCKDEVVIRNSDSGKVMGIKGRRVHMIEELSETIISFQRVNPGAKERLVQITGPTEDKITHARQLMEDTIRRNASPVREMVERERMGGSSSSLSSASDESNRLPQSGMRPKTLLHSFSTNDANIGEYKHTVSLGNEDIKIHGKNLELLMNVKLFLEEYYPDWSRRHDSGDGFRIGDEDVFITPAMAAGNGDPIGTTGPSFDYLSNQHSYPGSQERRAVLGRSVSLHSNNHFDYASNFEDTIGTSRIYSKEFLLECSLSPLSKHPPPEWDVVSKELPAIVKKMTSPFDPKAYAKRFAESCLLSNMDTLESD